MRNRLTLCVAVCLVASSLFSQEIFDQRRFWPSIMKGLLGPQSELYFKQMKHALLPDMKGTVVSATPRELLMAPIGGNGAEILLRPSKGRSLKALRTGAVVYFDCVALEFRREPFLLTCETDTVDVTLPAAISAGKHSK